MSESVPSLDYVDYPSISFPSDGLTVGKLRKLFPEGFDAEGAIHDFFAANAGTGPIRENEDWLSGMIATERLLARHAYESALGKAPTCLTRWGDSRRDCVVELAKYYIYFGLAAGPSHARQMIRDFEAEAESQAKPPQTPPRSVGR